MYGDLGNKLIIEAKRTEQLTQRHIDNSLSDDRYRGNGSKTMNIPMYNDELINNILKEVKQLKQNAEYFQKLREAEEENGNIENLNLGNSKIRQCQYFVNLLCLERNKRCLMAYQRMRSDMIDKLIWNGDLENSNIPNTPSAIGSDGISAGRQYEFSELSHNEQEYMNQYKNIIDDMSGESELWSCVEVMGNMNPPSDIFIDIRVLKDIGEIQTEYGTFNLVKDSQFYVRQSDVERLIQQGYVQKI